MLALSQNAQSTYNYVENELVGFLPQRADQVFLFRSQKNM